MDGRDIVIAVAVVVAVVAVLVGERIDRGRAHRIERGFQRGFWAFRAFGSVVLVVGGIVTGEWLAVVLGFAVGLLSGVIWLRLRRRDHERTARATARRHRRASGE
jgi:tellurite resistance protein TehA-like permease